jgi:hypothetical protein
MFAVSSKLPTVVRESRAALVMNHLVGCESSFHGHKEINWTFQSNVDISEGSTGWYSLE